MRPTRGAILVATLLGAGCTANEGGSAAPAAPKPAAEVVQPVPGASPATGTPVTTALRPASFVVTGEYTQGGYVRGQAPGGTTALTFDGEAIPFDSEGRFFAAFDRDAGSEARLVATLADGRRIESPLKVSPRAWNIEHVDVARLPGGPTEAFMKIRQPELDRIAAARAVDSGAQGWRQAFAWPVRGRISGRFGSQRIYRGGEAGSYHSGLDIAPGAGAAYSAPADGVVVLAATSPFSLEGNLLIIDHGNGLSSAFLHSQKLYVREGDRVTQGQHIGDVGMSGRATGPHLHWSLVWRGRRLDPMLFLPDQN